jgi:multidrug efflux pump subunit AcrA (membrane-fusion protein)
VSRWILPPAIGAFLILAAVFGAGELRSEDAQRLEVRREPFIRRVPASGELHSANNAAIGCPQIRRMWSFTITWLADEGIELAQGDPVLSFDAQQLNERLQVYRSRLDTARSKLERTVLEQQQELEKLELERAEIVARKARVEQKLAVPETMQARLELEKLRLDHELSLEEARLIDLRIEAQRDHREGSIRSAENNVAWLERDVRQLETYIAALNVKAPRSGFVVHVEGWDGNKPKVGESVWAGRSLLQIADLSEMEVRAEVAERDAQYVQTGQRVEIRLDASPDRVFAGEIRQLGKLFHTKSHEVPTMVFDALLSIDEPDPELMRPGMAASVEILAPFDRPVIQVPESAIRVTDAGPTVVVEREGGTRRVAVTLGPRWEGKVVVTEGLEEGDRIKVRADVY